MRSHAAHCARVNYAHGDYIIDRDYIIDSLELRCLLIVIGQFLHIVPLHMFESSSLRLKGDFSFRI